MNLNFLIYSMILLISLSVSGMNLISLLLKFLHLIILSFISLIFLILFSIFIHKLIKESILLSSYSLFAFSAFFSKSLIFSGSFSLFLTIFSLQYKLSNFSSTSVNNLSSLLFNSFLILVKTF